jgi:hypothetical protein
MMHVSLPPPLSTYNPTLTLAASKYGTGPNAVTVYFVLFLQLVSFKFASEKQLNPVEEIFFFNKVASCTVKVTL